MTRALQQSHFAREPNEDRMASPSPPPGPSLAFREWTVMLVRELRFYLPEVKVDVRGRDRVIWTLGNRSVRCSNAAGAYTITFGGETGPAPASLSDAGRHDASTARRFAKAVAAHFDPRFATVSSPPGSGSA